MVGAADHLRAAQLLHLAAIGCRVDAPAADAHHGPP